jgi:prepilin-type N-terminal cleavage/methylation domain-containing protein
MPAASWGGICRREVRDRGSIGGHYEMRPDKGFSLIELLIVVAIILIIVAIAIPDLLKSRQSANAASAVASLRTINSAEVTFASTYNTGYTSVLSVLDGIGVSSPSNAMLVDSILAGGEKSGYMFYYVACPSPPGPNDGTMTNGPCPTVYNYQVSANPIAPGNYYYTDASGVIRVNTSSYAGPSDPPLAG